MANSQYKYCEDTSYVDIHGRDIRVLVCEKTGRILIPIDELKEMGFSIYRKSQYNKLLIDDNQFNQEFNLFILQCAQTYMLKNKIAFKETEILESINNCKKLLSGGFKEPNKEANTSEFFQNHVIKEDTSNDISITRSFTEPAPVTTQNVNHMNNHKFPTHSRHSSTSSSSENTRRSKNFENSFDNRKPRNSFEQKRTPNTSFEQHKSENFNQSETTSATYRNNFKKPENSTEEKNKVQSLPSIQLTKPEHDVIVTHIERANAIWIQDTENSDVLLEIDRKIQEELEQERPAPRCEFNNVYLAKDEDAWYRCKPIKFKPLTVTFLDYGNTALVTQSNLREVSKELAQIPAQAVKVILEQSAKIDIYEKITLKINKKERSTYFATVSTTKSEEKSVPEDIKSRYSSEPKSSVSSVVKPKSAAFFEKPSPIGTLQTGQKVKLIGTLGRKLLVRTRDSHEKLNKIEQMMSTTEYEPFSSKPEKHQLVAIIQEDDKRYRGEIMSIDGSSANVALVDYFDQITVDLSQIRNISESLAKEPLTYLITPPLKNYDNGNEVACKYVQELVKASNTSTTKPIIVLDGEECDLKMNDQSFLSHKFKTFDGRVMLQNMAMYKPKLGPGTYMLYCYNEGNVTLVSEEEVEKYLHQVLNSNMDNDDPYVPIEGEVCFGYYQNNWSRCVVVKQLNKEYQVKFIDFGNMELLDADKLRKLTDEGKNVPVLGVACQIIGLSSVSKTTHKVIEEYLEEHIYCDLIVKKNDGEYFELEVPVLNEKIKEVV